MQLTQLVPSRSCLSIGCSLCCKLPSIDFPDHVKPPNEWCEDCTKPGCDVYETRPQVCRDFQCMWRYDFWPKDLDPKSTGCMVVFDKVHGRNDEGTTNIEFDMVRVHEARAGAAPVLDPVLRQLWDKNFIVTIYTVARKIRLIGWTDDGLRVVFCERPASPTGGNVKLPTITKRWLTAARGNYRKIQEDASKWLKEQTLD